uniref:C-type lectin domain-containing protein n=1 Tax=Panagrellus redivivus TaxID=6233 RepID=A0A7E4VBX6_PANRE
MSSQLVSIYSEEEYFVVSAEIQNQNFAGDVPVWIGLQSNNHNFYWPDNSNANYTHWINGTTSNATAGSCFAWYTTPANNGWWADDCFSRFPFVCKRHTYKNYVNVTANSGTITSFNYPLPYDADGNAIYFITVDPGYVVDLTFNIIGIDDYSLVNVYDGPNVNAPLLETVKKGSHRSMIESSSNKITLQFLVSPESNGKYIGWSANFDSALLETVSGAFMSPNFPANYDNNENVNYTIRVPDNLGIFIIFWSFQSEQNYDFLNLTSSCDNNSWNGGYSVLPFTYNLSCSYAYFNWKTDSSRTYQEGCDMGSYSLIFLILGANIIFCYGTLSNYHNVTVDAVTQCDEGWYYSLDLNQCYYISSELSSFNDAENKCNALSSHLVSVLSQEEYVVVSTQIQNQNFAGVNPAWIGLQSTSSADLYWTDSYSVNYTHWINTTDYPGGYCFAWFSTPANNGWWYQPCGQPLPFICKRHSYMNYVNITTNSGTITSPNYPQPFDADGNTIYFITVDPGYVIDLTFNFIAIDTYSLVNVYDGPNVTAPLLETQVIYFANR